jgi:hypothetical protein
MLASTIDIGFPPAWHSAVMQTQEQAQAPDNPPANFLARSAYFIGNAVTMARYGYAIEVAPVTDSVSRDYLPRTLLGSRLLALRRAYVANGGRLINAEQLDGEIRIRRGGAVDV